MTGTVSDLVGRLATDADFLDRKIMHGTAPAIARDIREAAKALTRLRSELSACREAVAAIRQKHENGRRLAKSKTGRDKANASLRVLDEIDAALSPSIQEVGE